MTPNPPDKKNNAQGKVPPTGTQKRNYRVRFLSNTSCESDQDVLGFLRSFDNEQFTSEISELKITNRQQDKSKTVKTANPCGDLYGLRRWQKSLLQQPNSVMLLKITRIKDEPLIVPLIMMDLFKNNRHVIIAGSTAAIQHRLQSSIDLQFKNIPPMIEANKELKSSLLDRLKRKSGFHSSIRTIGELSFLPEIIQEKLTTILSGKPYPALDDAEVINLCLLADLCSRYDYVIQSFTKGLQDGEQTISMLSSMFETLTSNITPPELIERLLKYVDEEDQANVKNKAMLCAYFYKFLIECDKSNKKEMKQLRSQFNHELREIVFAKRIEEDVRVYRRCSFLAEQKDSEKIVFHSTMAIYTKLNQFVEGKEKEFSSQDRVAFFMFLIQIAKKGKGEPNDTNSPQPQPPQPTQGLKRKPTAQESDNPELEQMVARKIFSQLGLLNFDIFALWDSRSDVSKLLDKPKELIRQLLSVELTRKEVESITQRLRILLYPYEKIAGDVQKAVVKVIEGTEGQKIKELEQIYIIQSLPEIKHYRFDLASKAIHPVERGCARSVLMNRLGFNVSIRAREGSDVTLFDSENMPKLGVFENPPELVAKAYVALLGQQTAYRVKQFTNHKINHLMKTYRKDFFETLYEHVVTQQDIPISRMQLVKILRSHNVLGNFMDKGWEEGSAKENLDPMFSDDILEEKQNIVLPEEFKIFGDIYQAHLKLFFQLLKDVRASAEKFPEQENPNVLLWSLFQKGIYNLSSKEASKIIKGSIFFKRLQSYIAYTSSKHYKEFTSDMTSQGVNLFIPRKYRELILIGIQFGFLVKEKLVRYNLNPTASAMKNLDQLSLLFISDFDAELQKDQPQKDVESLQKLVLLMRRCNRTWVEFSRSLTIACVDQVLTETVVKNARPGKILAQNLKFSIPDSQKMCLGRSIVGGLTLEFSKMLRDDEVRGSFLTNDKVTVTTLDEFAIAIHKVEILRVDLELIAGITKDILNIAKTLSYLKIEAKLIAKMEVMLEALVTILSKSLRDLTENDIQMAHKLARNLKGIRLALHNIKPSGREKRFITRLRDELLQSRSDQNNANLEFLDQFILETTDIKVMEKSETGEMKQRKREVEVSATHLTFYERMRGAIKIHKVLSEKDYYIFSPEGQKKKQIEYLKNTVKTIMSLKGNSAHFYIDITTLDTMQQQEIARLIQPTHFYKQQALTVDSTPVTLI